MYDRPSCWVNVLMQFDHGEQRCMAYILEAVLKRSSNVQPIECWPFGCYEDALPWKTTSANGNACLGLVRVVLGGICPNNVRDVTVKLFLKYITDMSYPYCKCLVQWINGSLSLPSPPCPISWKQWMRCLRCRSAHVDLSRNAGHYVACTYAQHKSFIYQRWLVQYVPSLSCTESQGMLRSDSRVLCICAWWKDKACTQRRDPPCYLYIIET